MSKLPPDLKPEDVLNVNVGVLGHVDSGKTSLVKALSTLLSTASLDKNPQSIARGITLDLGFSAFLLPLPSRLQGSASSMGGSAREDDATPVSENGPSADEVAWKAAVTARQALKEELNRVQKEEVIPKRPACCPLMCPKNIPQPYC